MSKTPEQSVKPLENPREKAIVNQIPGQPKPEKGQPPPPPLDPESSSIYTQKEVTVSSIVRDSCDLETCFAAQDVEDNQ